MINMNFIKKIYWWLKAKIANRLNGFPSKKIVLIGVTGTDGKTTTTSLIYHILVSLGKKASYITSVGANVAGKTYDTGFHVTTPSSLFIQKKIKEAVDKKDAYFVLETTSHAISQLRVAGCHYKIVALTNITPEHLDYHRNFMNYAKVKCTLLNKAEIAVVNTTPTNYYRYKDLIKNKNIWTCAVNKKADVNYSEIKKGIKKNWAGFEKENILVAYTVCKLLGLSSKGIIRSINTFNRVIGRFDYFKAKNQQFLIDFAHTPNAFQNLFVAIKSEFKYKRLIHVFGCAGLRDAYKREAMGKISSENSDIIILTEEDFRTENLIDILRAVEIGIKKVPKRILNSNYYFVENRQEAINLAIKIASKDDLIILTGKAHEKSLCRGKTEYPWDEYKAVEMGLNALQKPVFKK